MSLKMKRRRAQKAKKVRGERKLRGGLAESGAKIIEQQKAAATPVRKKKK